MYEFEAPIDVHKFSRLKFSLDALQTTEQFSVCLYESKGGVAEGELVGSEIRCKEVQSYGNIEIEIGSFFDYRATQVNSISFVQVNPLNPKSGKSVLSNLAIESGDKTDIIDDLGFCIDDNAYLTEEKACVCEENYVGSNGGKVLGEFDSCVPCLDCALDGDFCTRDRDCMMGSCRQDSVCFSAVSYI